MPIIYLVHTHTTDSLSSLLCVRLSVAFCSVVSWAHKSYAHRRVAWIYRHSAGVEKGKLTVGESWSFLKDQRARRFEVEDTPAHLGVGWIYVI